MTSYLITNKSQELIYLSDIGVRLEKYGDSAVIPRHLYDSSLQAKQVRHMISLRLFNSDKSFTKTANSKVVEYQKPPEEEPVVEEEPQVTLLKSIDNKLDALNSNISKLADALSNIPTSPTPSNLPAHLSAANVGSYQSTVADPVFIPSNIVPKGIETKINIQTDSSVRSDIDSATDVLKSLRKRK